MSIGACYLAPDSRVARTIVAVLLATSTLQLSSTYYSVRTSLAAPTLPAPSGAAILGLHVIGNRLVDASGRSILLRGVNRSGAEYACIQGWGIFDGPYDEASVRAIAAWHTNVVRIPLNEDCWLAINGVNAKYAGNNYRHAIERYVRLLNRNGLAAILDLHWNAPGADKATGQEPMPDADHSIAFWKSVATTFKKNRSVIFDLYNEPYPDSNSDSAAAWSCWRNGGTCPGISYQVAGMQTLVTAVRSTGATNVIMIGGVEYANSLSMWLDYEPHDPTGNLAASWHAYATNLCNSVACYDRSILPVIRRVPLIAGETGENDCAHGFVDGLMNWLDRHHASYLGWAWDTWDCKSGPALITDYSGTPTAYGIGLKNHLAGLVH